MFFMDLIAFTVRCTPRPNPGCHILDRTSTKQLNSQCKANYNGSHNIHFFVFPLSPFYISPKSQPIPSSTNSSPLTFQWPRQRLPPLPASAMADMELGGDGLGTRRWQWTWPLLFSHATTALPASSSRRWPLTGALQVGAHRIWLWATIAASWGMARWQRVATMVWQGSPDPVAVSRRGTTRGRAAAASRDDGVAKLAKSGGGGSSGCGGESWRRRECLAKLARSSGDGSSGRDARMDVAGASSLASWSPPPCPPRLRRRVPPLFAIIFPLSLSLLLPFMRKRPTSSLFLTKLTKFQVLKRAWKPHENMVSTYFSLSRKQLIYVVGRGWITHLCLVNSLTKFLGSVIICMYYHCLSQSLHLPFSFSERTDHCSTFTLTKTRPVWSDGIFWLN